LKSSLLLLPALVVALAVDGAASAAGSATRRPDLVVTRPAVSGTARPGRQVAVKHQVRNVGPVRARASITGYYLTARRETRARGRLLGVLRLPPIRARRALRRVVSLTIPGGVTAGSYTVLACADTANRLRERRETNNCRSSLPLTVRAPRRVLPVPGAPALNGHPADPTRSTTARFTFSTAESGVTFDCSLDSPAFSPCASPVEYSGLGDGVHAFAVRARNADGRPGQPTTFFWTVDITPPHAPWLTARPADYTRARDASFSFASYPGSTFTCRLDAAAFAPCSSPAFYAGPLAEGAHTFAVRASDPLGNESAETSISWTVDLTPPGPPQLISRPRDPTNVTTVSFDFGGVPDVAQWTCRLDSGPVHTCADPYFNPGPLGPGRHVFSVFARDYVGFEGPATTYSWTIDTTPPPAPVLDQRPENPSGAGAAVFTFSGSEPGATLHCSVDAGPEAPCSSPRSYSGLPDGERTWRVVARDAAGNSSAPATYRWMIDTTPPGQGLNIGVFAGGPSGVAAFRTWLGRPITRALDYFGYETWAEIATPGQIGTWSGRGYQMVYSVPMLPQSGATLAQGATGAFNSHFRILAEGLVREGQGNSVIRLGWEFNGFWYPWTAMNDPASFIAYWRRIVTTMRGVPGANFKFDWCTVFGPASMNPETAYPGDAYVDYIGMSLFDQDWYPGWDDPVLRWRNFIYLPFGLQWQRDFARAHGKQIAFDEWALSIRLDGHGGGDNPYYVDQVYRWFNARDNLADGRRRVAYAMYFEEDKPDDVHRLQSGLFPLGAARVRALFGTP
jgi:CARDB/Glycosyl hydrolase family 26